VNSDLRKAYEAYHPHLPEFMVAAMKVFAERELSSANVPMQSRPSLNARRLEFTAMMAEH
jgi:hypothetical protein